MNFHYDVAIVGGGPIGSTLAYHLSKEKLNICIIEKKKEVGFPLQCAGIVSKSIANFNEVPNDVIINKVKGAYLHSPNEILKVQKQEEEAYVIDRISYDRFLLKRAIKNNVKLIREKVINVDYEKGTILCESGKAIKSKIIVGADGYKSKISNILKNEYENFHASQLLVEISNIAINKFRKSNDLNTNEYVDTCVKEELLPGFLWFVPVEENLFRVGLFSNHSYKEQNQFLKDFLRNNFKEDSYKILEKYKGIIPIYNDKITLVKERVLLIGDAACQIKPTTGGGLLIGFDSCRIASEYIIKAIKNNDIAILNRYAKEFKKQYLKEFNYQFKVQKTLNILSNDDLDYFFNKLKENDCENLISQYGDMDKQSILIKEFIKRGLIFKVIPNFFIKIVSKIFGIK